MKVCILQPLYSVDYSRSDELFERQLELLAQCDETMDIIVMPESCDIPCLAPNKEAGEASSAKFRKILLDAVAQTARKCNAIVFVNARSESASGQRNTTYAFDRSGQIVGMYHKQHLTPGEVSKIKLDSR